MVSGFGLLWWRKKNSILEKDFPLNLAKAKLPVVEASMVMQKDNL